MTQRLCNNKQCISDVNSELSNQYLQIMFSVSLSKNTVMHLNSLKLHSTLLTLFVTGAVKSAFFMTLQLRQHYVLYVVRLINGGKFSLCHFCRVSFRLIFTHF